MQANLNIVRLYTPVPYYMIKLFDANSRKILMNWD